MYSNNKEHLELIAQQLAQLVWSKGEAYGDSITTSASIMHILYPASIPPNDYYKALALVRVIDKLCRIANGAIGQENPWQDIAGYALRMLAQEEVILNENSNL